MTDPDPATGRKKFGSLRRLRTKLADDDGRSVFGTYKAVNAAEIEAMPGVVHHHVGVRAGDRVNSIINHTVRAGHIIAVGSSRDEAVQRAASVIKELPILVDSESSG